MSPDPVSSEFFKGPAYALVIGISNYARGKAPDQLVALDEFPNLICAAKDAADVATFLTGNGFIEYNVTALIEEQATLGAIKEALENLRRQCRKSGSPNPLVIVYFAGHGMADDDEDTKRHYLVPHDARRDRLISTALETSEFQRFLNALDTTRLVVFLDACHAGAMSQEGSRDAAAAFVPPALGEGSGRYVIASCGPNQKSWEWKDPKRKNGIFTWHLLELLKCEQPDFVEEEIDIFTLFPKLRDRVKRSAKAEHGADQEPVGDIKGATGIVLAINQRARQERVDREHGTAEKRKRLFEAVSIGISSVESDQHASMRAQLRTYVLGGKKRGVEFADFYQIFDEHVAGWQPEADPQATKLCQLLADEYLFAATQALARPLEPNPVVGPKVVDKFVEAAEKTPATSEARPVTAPTAAPAAPVDKSRPRRQLTADDRAYLLADIRAEVDYVGEAKELDSALRRPLSDAEFAQTWHHVRTGKEDDDRLDALLGEVMKRFKERWPNAKEALASTNAAALMYRVQP